MDRKKSGLYISLAMLACVLPASLVSGEGPSTSESANATAAGAAVVDSKATENPLDPSMSALQDMNLEQLMQVEVATSTLTMTERKLVPAAVTHIDRDEIDQANPRNLYELLDIYTPEVYYAFHQWEMPHIIIRGIVGEDKYLLLVNGREMNERTHAGVLSERDLRLMGDLHQVDVVRGPGSAVYGPGAVSGVVSLETYNGLTFQGTDITARGGVYDEFYSVEAKHGAKLGPDTGWFVYGGAAIVDGADRKYSPFIQGQDFPAPYGDVTHGHPVRFPFPDLGSTYSSDPQLKFHAQFDSGGLTLWTRYTNGGTKNTIADRGWLAAYPFGFLTPLPAAQVAVHYQQITAFAGYKHAISKTLSLDLSSSLDYTEYQRITPGNVNNTWVNGLDSSHGEIKSITKGLVYWTPNSSQQLAGGFEYEHLWLGLPALSDEGDGPIDIPRFGGDTVSNGEMPRWQTDMISFIVEDQWKINDQFTTFVGGRADKHTFTNWLFSPRGALVYTPNKKDAIKLIASQSLRTNVEEEMKFQHDMAGTKSDPEIMRTYEMRYERQHNENLSFGGGIFYNDLDVLGYDQNTFTNKNLGSYQTVGAEAEFTYHTHDSSITFSHSFTKLVNFELNDGVTTSLSAAPLGEGWDLASYPQQMTKLTGHRQLNQKWSVDGSTRVDWNFPGDKDFLKFGNAHPILGDSFNGFPANSVPGWNPFGPSIFVDMGLQYKLNEHTTVRFDAYNIVGWINGNYNKREFVSTQWFGQYREEAPSIGISLKYEF